MGWVGSTGYIRPRRARSDFSSQGVIQRSFVLLYYTFFTIIFDFTYLLPFVYATSIFLLPLPRESLLPLLRSPLLLLYTLSHLRHSSSTPRRSPVYLDHSI